MEGLEIAFEILTMMINSKYLKQLAECQELKLVTTNLMTTVKNGRQRIY